MLLVNRSACWKVTTVMLVALVTALVMSNNGIAAPGSIGKGPRQSASSCRSMSASKIKQLCDEYYKIEDKIVEELGKKQSAYEETTLKLNNETFYFIVRMKADESLRDKHGNPNRRAICKRRCNTDPLAPVEK